MKTVAAVAVGIVVGCGSARYVAPPKLAEAQAATATRWDYFCTVVGTADLPGFERKAKEAGAQGWELAGASSMGAMFWCFKRPLP